MIKNNIQFIICILFLLSFSKKLNAHHCNPKSDKIFALCNNVPIPESKQVENLEQDVTKILIPSVDRDCDHKNPIFICKQAFELNSIKNDADELINLMKPENAHEKAFDEMFVNDDHFDGVPITHWLLGDVSESEETFTEHPSLGSKNNATVSNSNPVIKDAEFEKLLKDQYMRYAEAYNCKKVSISHRYSVMGFEVPESYIKTHTEGKYNKKRIEEKYAMSSELKDRKDSTFDRINNASLKTSVDEKLNSHLGGLVYCDKNAKPKLLPTNQVYLSHECAGSISAEFANGQWTLSNEKINQLINTDAGKELQKCINEKLQHGEVVKNISIHSSSSALKNSEPALTAFGAEGFYSLSKARANFAKDHLLPKLFPKLILAKSKIPVIIDPGGTNHDGTSGPCPYTIVNNKFVHKPEYDNINTKNNAREKLEKYKFVQIHISFAEKIGGVLAGNIETDRYLYKCKEIRFHCKE